MSLGRRRTSAYAPPPCTIENGLGIEEKSNWVVFRELGINYYSVIVIVHNNLNVFIGLNWRVVI